MVLSTPVIALPLLLREDHFKRFTVLPLREDYFKRFSNCPKSGATCVTFVLSLTCFLKREFGFGRHFT